VSDPNAITTVRRYSWGLDLAGLSGAQSGSIGVSPVSLEAAGTIGGLLAMNDPADDPNDVARDYVYFHDASGNVTQLVDLAADPNAVVADPTTAIVAHYEYGPYGRRVNADPNNPDAYAQPFGFSGKYWDAETGMGNWGRRYYHPALGRWISRDPIGEAGGVNQYTYGANAPANSVDPFGDIAIAAPLIPPAVKAATVALGAIIVIIIVDEAIDDAPPVDRRQWVCTVRCHKRPTKPEYASDCSGYTGGTGVGPSEAAAITQAKANCNSVTGRNTGGKCYCAHCRKGTCYRTGG